MVHFVTAGRRWIIIYEAFTSAKMCTEWKGKAPPLPSTCNYQLQCIEASKVQADVILWIGCEDTYIHCMSIKQHRVLDYVQFSNKDKHFSII